MERLQPACATNPWQRQLTLSWIGILHFTTAIRLNMCVKVAALCTITSHITAAALLARDSCRLRRSGGSRQPRRRRSSSSSSSNSSSSSSSSNSSSRSAAVVTVIVLPIHSETQRCPAEAVVCRHAEKVRCWCLRGSPAEFGCRGFGPGVTRRKFPQQVLLTSPLKSVLKASGTTPSTRSQGAELPLFCSLRECRLLTSSG